MVHEAILVALIPIVYFLLIMALVFLIIVLKTVQKAEETQIELDKPKFKQLTDEQIADIHSRGKLTPAEKVKEWEELDLCAPGDAIGSAAWRCKKFKYCCHDCLIDYANKQDEHESIFENLKVVNHEL